MFASGFFLAAMVATTTVFPGTPMYSDRAHWRAASWHDAVQSLPCSAFVPKPNGRWTMPGKIDLPQHAVIINMTFGPDAASRSLDARCGYVAGVTTKPPQ